MSEMTWAEARVMARDAAERGCVVTAFLRTLHAAAWTLWHALRRTGPWR